MGKGRRTLLSVNDDKNQALYKQYKKLADQEENVIFGGRLATYKYYDMHHVISHALTTAEKELGELVP